MGLKILVVSDSHGSRQRLQRIIDQAQPFQHLIHCGDGVDDLQYVQIPAGVVVLRVQGNMDRSQAAVQERIIETDMQGVRLLVCHGDQFAAHLDYDRLLNEGLRRGVDLICCGHTHIKYLHDHPPLLFNPGPANKGQYGIITLPEGADEPVHCTHKRVQ